MSFEGRVAGKDWLTIRFRGHDCAHLDPDRAWPVSHYRGSVPGCYGAGVGCFE